MFTIFNSIMIKILEDCQDDGSMMERVAEQASPSLILI
jgi:hypothetical protein